MSPSPRAFSRREPFDGPLFLRRLYLQPAAVWLALALLAKPASRAALRLLGASCAGPARDSAAAAALIAYILLVPVLGAAVWHFACARRRLDKPAHRRIADLSLALLLTVSAGNAVVLARQASAHRAELSRALFATRAACWPGR